MPYLERDRLAWSDYIAIATHDWLGAHWIRKGDAARRQGRLDLALRRYGRTRRARIHLVDTWVGSGCQHAAAGRDAEAEAAFRSGMAVLPHRADPHAQLGFLRLRQNRPDEAAAFLLDALRRDSRRQDIFEALDGIGRGREAATVRDDPDRYPLEGQLGSHLWFHSLDLGNGLRTEGFCSPSFMKARYRETFGPLTLDGKSVADIGAWNGGFSLEARRRGAGRVAAIDAYTWNSPVYRARETVDLVNRATGAAIETIEADVDVPQLDLSPLGRFDVVLFLGVFYHLLDPLAALREVSAMASDVLVVETSICWPPTFSPQMRLYPGNQLRGDPTNWWVPNVTAMKDLLRLHGFKRIDFRFGCGPDRGVFHAYRT